MPLMVTTAKAGGCTLQGSHGTVWAGVPSIWRCPVHGSGGFQGDRVVNLYAA